MHLVAVAETVRRAQQGIFDPPMEVLALLFEQTLESLLQQVLGGAARRAPARQLLATLQAQVGQVQVIRADQPSRQISKVWWMTFSSSRMFPGQE